MRFIVDAQLPPLLARWLVAKGHVAEHVAARLMARAADTAIWDLALREDLVIVTKDEDFSQRKILAGGGPKIVCIRWPNTRRRGLMERFETVLPDVVSALERGETLIEVI